MIPDRHVCGEWTGLNAVPNLASYANQARTRVFHEVPTEADSESLVVNLLGTSAQVLRLFKNQNLFAFTSQQPCCREPGCTCSNNDDVII